MMMQGSPKRSRRPLRSSSEDDEAALVSSAGGGAVSSRDLRDEQPWYLTELNAELQREDRLSSMQSAVAAATAAEEAALQAVEDAALQASAAVALSAGEAEVTTYRAVMALKRARLVELERAAAWTDPRVALHTLLMGTIDANSSLSSMATETLEHIGSFIQYKVDWGALEARVRADPKLSAHPAPPERLVEQYILFLRAKFHFADWLPDKVAPPMLWETEIPGHEPGIGDEAIGDVWACHSTSPTYDEDCRILTGGRLIAPLTDELMQSKHIRDAMQPFASAGDEWTRKDSDQPWSRKDSDQPPSWADSYDKTYKWLSGQGDVVLDRDLWPNPAEILRVLYLEYDGGPCCGHCGADCDERYDVCGNCWAYSSLF